MKDIKNVSIIVVRGNTAILHDINRENFLDLMLSLKKNYTKNNQIACQFLECLPETETIIIYEDRNEEVDVPLVIIRRFDGSERALKIPRCHKIIWGILDEFSK